MNRRKLLIALGAGAFAVPLGTFAQQQGKVWRVGFLNQRRRPESFDGDIFGAFRDGMRDLGYIEGRNLVIEWRFADDKVERLPALATELVQLNVDILVIGGAPATSAAQKATQTIPIVMASSGDPQGDGFVKSLARPSGNITGLSSITSDIIPKHLEMLLGMRTRLARVALLMNSDNSTNVAMLKALQGAARKPGIAIMPFDARNPQDIEQAFARMIRQKCQALVIAREPVFNRQVRQIAELATKKRLPAIAGLREYVEAGGLMSYGASLTGQFKRAATYVDKIFKGAHPGDLPVEQPTTFELFINGRTAKALGLKIPHSLRISADKVIE